MDPETFAATGSRDANGRFLLGQSGNPASKRPGTRNRATLIREALDGDEEGRLGERRRGGRGRGGGTLSRLRERAG